VGGDTYIALFSKFIPVGVWEAVYLIQGLLEQQSKTRPSRVHTDTQGQALPVYALAHLFGFDLMPRVHNWKDLNFYRPAPQSRYRHNALLRRLSTYSRRNNIYQAFREIGRAIRTVQLLRFLSDAQLRRRTTAETALGEQWNEEWRKNRIR
jgi:TnpA family transposase